MDNIRNAASPLKAKTVKFFKSNWYIFLAVAIAVAIICSGIKLVVVVGESMSPTLQDGEGLLMSTKQTPKRGDIVVFRNEKDEGKILIKRVIALPGESIRMADNKIYINGKEITDPNPNTVITEDPGCLTEGITLKTNEWFLMGDNRNNSNDSRNFGAVKQSQIIGVVLFRFPSFADV